MKKALIFVFLNMACITLFAGDTLFVRDYGIVPNTGMSVKNRLNELLNTLPDEHIVVKLDEGRYDFFPDSNEFMDFGMIMKNKSSFTLDGGGASFIFHGLIGVMYVESSAQVVLKNFTVDWDRTLISQGTIEEITENYVDVSFDRDQYPYEIESDSIRFVGENWKLGVDVESYSTIYNPKTRDIEYLTRDKPLSSDNSLFRAKVSEIGANTVRFHGKVEKIVSIGSILTLYHGRYMVPGIYVARSKNVHMENITLYHALSMGVISERNENLSFEKVNMRINTHKDRVFSGLADAFHLVSTKGTIRITDCIHEGQGDDFANVRGVYVPILQIDPDRRSIEIGFHRSSPTCFFGEGDNIWLVSKSNVTRETPIRVNEVEELKNEQGEVRGFKLSLDTQVPKGIGAEDFVENASWNPDLYINRCYIGKRNRARGLLITTPGKVVVENCYFATAGTAILIEGDIDYWYEAGGVRDLTIRNNVFDNCITSASSHGNKWEWGEAIITITPSFRPTSEYSPAYHENIRIENNIIRTFDIPLIVARSVKNLSFVNNNIIRTYDYEPFAWQKVNFSFDGCRNVIIEGNTYSTDFIKTLPETAHMSERDIIYSN